MVSLLNTLTHHPPRPSPPEKKEDNRINIYTDVFFASLPPSSEPHRRYRETQAQHTQGQVMVRRA